MLSERFIEYVVNKIRKAKCGERKLNIQCVVNKIRKAKCGERKLNILNCWEVQLRKRQHYLF